MKHRHGFALVRREEGRSGWAALPMTFGHNADLDVAVPIVRCSGPNTPLSCIVDAIARASASTCASVAPPAAPADEASGCRALWSAVTDRMADTGEKDCAASGIRASGEAACQAGLGKCPGGGCSGTAEAVECAGMGDVRAEPGGRPGVLRREAWPGVVKATVVGVDCEDASEGGGRANQCSLGRSWVVLMEVELSRVGCDRGLEEVV